MRRTRQLCEPSGHEASMTLAQRTISMRSTFDTTADIITLICGVPREQITPDSSLLDDLGIDSLELLDVAFAIDDAFSITRAIDQWLQAVHVGRVSGDQYFVLKEFCAHIDDLTAAASTPAVPARKIMGVLAAAPLAKIYP
jgi:acyl carrier protein